MKNKTFQAVSALVGTTIGAGVKPVKFMKGKKFNQSTACFQYYFVQHDGVVIKTFFVPRLFVDLSIPVSTPFTFPVLDKKFVLVKDKMGWWNPAGGHIQKGESWREALKREAIEEAGVVVERVKVFGVIFAVRLTETAKSEYPKVTQLPMTVSKVKTYIKNWQARETLGRKIVTARHALQLLRLRDDNLQMYRIFKYLIQQLSRSKRLFNEFLIN